MKFLGKLKPFVIPVLLGVLGAYIYDRWVKSRLPQMLQAVVLAVGLALASDASANTFDSAPGSAAVLQLDSTDAGAAVPAAPVLATVEPGWLIACALGAGLLLLAFRGSARKGMGIAAVLAVLAFGCTPAFAETIIAKGGAIVHLQWNQRGNATNIANFTRSAVLRVVAPDGTNQFGFDTNGTPFLVSGGVTNATGVTGFFTNAIGSGKNVRVYKGIIIGID